MQKPYANDMTIQLTPDQEALVTGALAQCASKSAEEFITKALRNQLDEEAALDHWLRTEIVQGHEEYLRDPTTGTPAGELLNAIKARRNQSS